jgi:hypothetical protein
MTDNCRFGIFMLASSAVFASALLFVLRTRPERQFRRICALTGVVVVGGMLFARYAHLYANLWPAVYYGLPASLTLFLPIVSLRMSRNEALQYVPFAVLMAPFIHVVFSLLLGWHDYMPFPFWIPSLRELMS